MREGGREREREREGDIKVNEKGEKETERVNETEGGKNMGRRVGGEEI